MKRQDALAYVSFGVDDALCIHNTNVETIPADARLVGWQCGFEPMFVAVWSYLNVRLNDEEAEDLAADALRERNWFVDPEADNPADYVI